MDALMKKLEYYMHFFGYAKDERPGTANETDHTDLNGRKY